MVIKLHRLLTITIIGIVLLISITNIGNAVNAVSLGTIEEKALEKAYRARKKVWEEASHVIKAEKKTAEKVNGLFG